MACTDGSLLYRRLEADFNVERAVPVARAALGLMAVLDAWVDAGHVPRVALCATICHDVVAAVLGAGCTPIFLDIDPLNGLVPSQEWARARAAGASVALVVHLFGNPSDVLSVRHYFPEAECLLIDDAAQALGAANAVGLVGGQGDVGLLSFGATKHISVGGAAMLFKSTLFAEAAAERLLSYKTLPEKDRSEIHVSFRRRLEVARAQLRNVGDAGVVAFDGLLDGYSPTLSRPFPDGAAQAAYRALNTFPHARALRLEKCAAWAAGLAGSPLCPVGMQAGAVPWRYTCRMQGMDWIGQHRLGEAMRRKGLNVSHWYLPAHWMCGYGPGTLCGVEQLARELFQFWVDEDTPIDVIKRDVPMVRALAIEAASS